MEKGRFVVNRLPYDIPRNALADLGIYPLERWRERGTNRIAFRLPLRYRRDQVIQAIHMYIYEEYEGHNIQVLQGKQEGTVIASWVGR